MLAAYHKSGLGKTRAVFDVFYRSSDMSYAVTAGLEQVIQYLQSLKFSAEDIEYLSSLGKFDAEFLAVLKKFRFTGDVYAVPEGTVVFPGEPYFQVTAPLFEAQFIETAVLCMLNHQTLIATKASKMVTAAGGLPVAEFGLRRAQGAGAAIYGARAAVIGGAGSTSNVLAGKMFGLPVSGTMAHSFIMAHESELEAFRAFAKTYPNGCILLVDTYDTLKSGVPNAIIAFKELIKDGGTPLGIRLDSGDLAYLSVEARKLLDAAGLNRVKIFASGDIDEKVLLALSRQNAKTDAYGIGTKLITGGDSPALGGVYKLSALEKDGKWVPKMKMSDTARKVTNPGLKKTVRFYDRASGKALADVIALAEESFEGLSQLEIFHPDHTWLKKTLTNFTVRELMVPIFKAGKLVYKTPALTDIAAYAKAEQNTLWEQYKREINPHIYKVDLSRKLWELKQRMLGAQTVK